MPNGNTFLVKPIKQFILDNKIKEEIVIDPFANKCPLQKYFTNCSYISNDLDSEMSTTYHMDALDFFKTI